MNEPVIILKSGSVGMSTTLTRNIYSIPTLSINEVLLRRMIELRNKHFNTKQP